VNAGVILLMTMSYTVGVEQFAGLEKPWHQLLSDSPINHVFFTPQWQLAWWQAFGNSSEMLLLSIRRDDKLVGIAPLMRNNEEISFIGNSDVCDYMDFIALRGEEEPALSQVMDYLENAGWTSIELHSLLPQSLGLTQFVPLARHKGHRVEISQEDVSPELMLPSSWDEYLAQLTKKDRHEVRRKMRRLEQAGATRFYSVTEKDKILQVLPDFFRLFKLSQGEKAGFMTERRKAFFEALTDSLGEADYIKLYYLELDGIRVSYVICFDYQNELYLYNSAYDPAFSSVNVGLLLKLYCLQESIAEGKRRFDFLRGNERYKYELGGRDVPVYHCVISRSKELANS
jgi:CelD/BcsL family acetyltransferase involved in cellulose biosynthesis